MVQSPSPLSDEGTLRIRNRSGITQVIFGTGITMEAGGIADVPRSRAIPMLKRRTAEMVLPEDTRDCVWRDEDGNVQFYWMSPFSQGDGYATAAENMVYSLLQLGVRPAVNNCWFLVTHGLRPETLELIREPIMQDYMVGICMATPGEFAKLPTPYKIGWTMFETDNPLIEHPEWRHQCNEVDHLLVPCDWNIEVFSKLANVPITALPLAIHEGYLLRPGQKPKKPKDTFTFVSYAALSGRKSPLETLELFQKVFPLRHYPDVRIRFKTRVGLFGIGTHNVPKLRDPRVEVVDATWSQAEMRQYLDDADCMIFLSKGEGFGLPPRESMATGVPTILTNHSGMVEVCDDRYNWPVPYTHTEESKLGGDWYIPDWDYAADAMKWVYENREKAYKKAFAGAQWMRDSHGPLLSAEKLMEFLYRLEPVPKFRHKERAVGIGRSAVEKHRQEHEWFYRRLMQWYPPGKSAFCVSVDSSPSHVVMHELGYNVVTFVVNGQAAYDATLANLELNNVQGQVFSRNPFKMGRTTLNSLAMGPRNVVVVADGLSYYSPYEIPKVMHKMLQMGESVMFTVPSVYYPNPRFTGEQLFRAEQWKYILNDFLIRRMEYYGGPDKNYYLMGWVIPGDGARGYQVQHYGRMNEGVWRPPRR